MCEGEGTGGEDGGAGREIGNAGSRHHDLASRDLATDPRKEKKRKNTGKKEKPKTQKKKYRETHDITADVELSDVVMDGGSLVVLFLWAGHATGHRRHGGTSNQPSLKNQSCISPQLPPLSRFAIPCAPCVCGPACGSACAHAYQAPLSIYPLGLRLYGWGMPSHIHGGPITNISHARPPPSIRPNRAEPNMRPLSLLSFARRYGSYTALFASEDMRHVTCLKLYGWLGNPAARQVRHSAQPSATPPD